APRRQQLVLDQTAGAERITRDQLQKAAPVAGVCGFEQSPSVGEPCLCRRGMTVSRHVPPCLIRPRRGRVQREISFPLGSGSVSVGELLQDQRAVEGLGG